MKGRTFAVAVGLLLFAPSADAATHPNAGALSSRLHELSSGALRSASAGEIGDALSLPARGAGSLLRLGDSAVVEVRVDGRTYGRVDGLEDAGAGAILNVSPRYRTITAAVPVADLRDVGDAPGVESVTEVLTPMTGAAESLPDGAATGTINTCQTGIISEGDAQLKANAARSQFDVDGSGTKVGVLSDSFNSLGGQSSDVVTSNLPGPGNPCGRTTPVQVLQDFGGADEGRAMLQIVHDLAPGADLAFATAFTGELGFASNIRQLAANGADVIADDILYFAEPMYQDGPIAAAVDDVTAQGVDYFSMAYNSNRIVGGRNVNSWEATAYRPTGCPAALPAGGDCMDFNPGGGGGDNTFQVTAASGASIRLSLGWAEPQQGVTDDFDFYALNAAGTTVLASSTDNNAVTGKAFEFLGLTPNALTTFQLVIRRAPGDTGTPAIKWINSDNAGAGFTGATPTEYNSSNSTDTFGPTIFGHNGAAAAQTLAAVPFNNPNTVENFSARGPVTYYFQPADGVNPAPALGAPQLVSKPDVAATDGVQNTFFGFNDRFFGTSASAPHAAAVGALQEEANPDLSPTQIYAAQRSTAVPVGAFGPLEVGSGLIDAQAAIASAPPTSPLNLSVSGPSVTNDPTPDFTISANRHLKTLSCAIDGGAGDTLLVAVHATAARRWPAHPRGQRDGLLRERRLRVDFVHRSTPRRRRSPSPSGRRSGRPSTRRHSRSARRPGRRSNARSTRRRPCPVGRSSSARCRPASTSSW